MELELARVIIPFTTIAPIPVPVFSLHQHSFVDLLLSLLFWHNAVMQ
jgi:hypothetical protein